MAIVDEEKKQTILNLSVELNGAIGRLQDRLDNSFNRSPMSAEGKTERPQASNILDDIIENITEAQEKIAYMHGFIVEKVLQKIH